MSSAGDGRVHVMRLIARSFVEVVKAFLHQAYTEFWLKGGRASSKSSVVSLLITLGLMMDDLANAIIYRKVAATLRDSVYGQMVWAIEALGLTAEFRCSYSPMEITRVRTGQKILFRGCDDPAKSKSIKLAHGYFKFLWFEELSEFHSTDEVRIIQASVIRGSAWACTFYTYNPPASMQNWTNGEAMKIVPGRLVHHSDYTQVPSSWVGASFIAIAEALKASNERAYRHTYLGEVTGTGGQVFDNLRIERITEELRSNFDRHHNGMDFGFAVDPDVVLRMHYDKRRRWLYLLDEIYGAGMNIDTLAQKTLALCGSEVVRPDSADPRMIHELKRRGVRAIGAEKGPGSVEHGMRWLQDLGAIIIDPERCPNAEREFCGYEYPHDKHGNFLAVYPDKDNHTIDAARYGMEPEMERKVIRAPGHRIPGL